MQYSFAYCCSVEAENSSPLKNSTPDNGITLPLCSPSEEKQTPFVHDVHDPALYISKKLSDDDKVSFLTSKYILSQNFTYRVTDGRKFNPTWMQDRPWLQYSVAKDKAFCAYCIFFAANKNIPGGPSSTSHLSPFVSCGFGNWKKETGKDNNKDNNMNKRMLSESHKTAEEMAHSFLSTCQPGTDIVAKPSKQKSDQ
jgi:hypothetical protein